MKKTEKTAVSRDLKGHFWDKDSPWRGNGYWILGQHYLTSKVICHLCMSDFILEAVRVISHVAYSQAF